MKGVLKLFMKLYLRAVTALKTQMIKTEIENRINKEFTRSVDYYCKCFILPDT